MLINGLDTIFVYSVDSIQIKNNSNIKTLKGIISFTMVVTYLCTENIRLPEYYLQFGVIYR